MSHYCSVCGRELTKTDGPIDDGQTEDDAASESTEGQEIRPDGEDS
jgi:hypothetical protein